MTYDKFVGEVQNRAKSDSEEEAARAVQASLQTLAEKLDAGEAKDLAAQLPREFEVCFQVPRHGVHMSLDDFFRRVSKRERLDLPESVYHARMVMEVLQEAVSAEEIERVFSQLPDEWRALFKAVELHEPAEYST